MRKKLKTDSLHGGFENAEELSLDDVFREIVRDEPESLIPTDLEYPE